MKRIFLVTVFLLGFGIYIFSQAVFVHWDNLYLTYNGALQAPTASVDTMGTQITLVVTGAQTDAGAYLATANFPASYTGSFILQNPTETFFISSYMISIQWGNRGLTYTGSPQTPTASATGVIGENVPLSISGAEIYAGTGYMAYATLNPVNPNYFINHIQVGASDTLNFYIDRATIPVVWTNTTLTHTGSPLEPTATVTGFLSENVPVGVTGAQTNIGGPYTATATLSAPNTLPGSNYTLSNTTTPFTIVATPANTYTVVWSNTSTTFTGYQQAPTAVATNTFGTNIAINVTGAQINAGYGYIATAALTTPNSSIILINASTTFSINPATIPVQWGNTTLTYTGNPQAPTATAKGVMDENLPLTVKGEQTDAGIGYTATASLTTTNYNYTLTNTTTQYEIVQPPVISDPYTYTVAWDDRPLTYTGEPQTPTATASNELGESIAITVRGAKTNVGIGYLALAELTIPSGRITLLNAMTIFEIAPATIPVVWGDVILYYNGSPQAPTASLKDIMGEDLPINIAGAQTNVGTGYTATASLRTPDNNYTLTNTSILFSIVQATPYNVVWGNKSFTYNAAPQAPTATATNDQGQSVAITVTGAQINVGTAYTATAALTVPNSSIALNNATTLFDIAPAPLDIVAVSETIIYGRTPVLAYTLRSGQLFGNDALTGVLSVETLQATSPQRPYPVGEYVIVQGTLTASNNYTINFTKGSLIVINEQVFDIIVNSKSAKREGGKFYGDPAENGENQAEVYVLANPDETIEIEGQRQNPRTVTLPLYGDNLYAITVTPQNGTPQNHTLIIERYYEKVYFEYPDIPTISCNTITNGGLTFSDFQWYREDEPMEDATGQYIRVNDNATYYCVLTPNDYNNARLRTINVRSLDLRASDNLTAYPNPTQGKVTISSGANARTHERTNGRTDEGAKSKIQVFDLNGVLVLQPETNPFDMSILPQGMYFIRVNGKSAKVIKTN